MLTTYVTTEKQLFDMIIFYDDIWAIYCLYSIPNCLPGSTRFDSAQQGFAFPAVKLVMKMKKAQGSELM